MLFSTPMLPHQMPSKLLEYPDTLIVIISNNVVFSLAIPQKIQNKGFEDFVTYLTTRPLCYDLANVVDPFLPQHVCEFYYTCTYYDTGVTISTIRDGEHTISMYVTDVRRALHLPIQNEYFPLPSMDECHVVLEKLDYDFNAQDNSNVLRIYIFQLLGSFSLVSLGSVLLT